MSNFLALCQKTARDSGTVSGTVPTAVTGQTDWPLQIVNAVIDAWTNIQLRQNDWRWMEGEFGGATIANTKRYTASSWSLTRFSRWIIRPKAVTIYLTATGVSDESELRQITFERWKEIYDRGSQTSRRPCEYAVSPANEFCLGPVPDAVYTVRGPYQKSAQTLAANSDTPEFPEQFHNLVVYEAMEILAGFDEAPIALADARKNAARLWTALMRDQLPQIDAFGGGPIA